MNVSPLSIAFAVWYEVLHHSLSISEQCGSLLVLPVSHWLGAVTRVPEEPPMPPPTRSYILTSPECILVLASSMENKEQFFETFQSNWGWKLMTRVIRYMCTDCFSLTSSLKMCRLPSVELCPFLSHTPFHSRICELCQPEEAWQISKKRMGVGDLYSLVDRGGGCCCGGKSEFGGSGIWGCILFPKIPFTPNSHTFTNSIYLLASKSVCN